MCIFVCQVFQKCHRKSFVSDREVVLNLTGMIEGSLNSDRFSIIRLTGGCWVGECEERKRKRQKKKAGVRVGEEKRKD